MTLINNLDLDILKMYLHNNMNLLSQGSQKLEHYIQTDATQNFTALHLWVASMLSLFCCILNCFSKVCKLLNIMLYACIGSCSASDWTMYPFSTQNYQDYQNLMSVYLDAVFYPLLRHLDFW